MPLDDTSSAHPEVELKELSQQFRKVNDEVKTWAEKVMTEMKNLGKSHEETKAEFDKSFMDLNGLQTRLTDVEQKVARRGGPALEPEVKKTLGQHLIENPEVKSRLLDGPKKGTVHFSVETKAILSNSTYWGSTADVSNALVVADRQPGMLALPMRPMTVRDLVAPGTTTSNNVEYAIQTTRTNNAAVVAEGALKPTSTYAWDLRSFPVRTIAHLVKASRQILDDAPALQSIIDAEMRYGLAYAEENEILNGDGTGQHLTGLIPSATAYSATFSVTGETAIDRLRQAILQGLLALHPVSGIVLHPTDWAKVEMIKDAQGRYLVGDPQGVAQPMLWNLPVVASQAMTAGTFIVGAFRTASQVFDRMNVEVLVSTENNDDFEKNLLTIRAEERLTFVCKFPLAFVTGNLP
jgi:HK97 family phage major capsid protein